MIQVHSLALWLVELRPQRSWQDSNLRERELQSRASPLGHMIDSAQCAATRRTGIEPVVPGFGDRCSAIGTFGVSHHSMRRTGLEPVQAEANAFTARYICRSVTCASERYAPSSQRGRIRTFDPVRPRHVRCQTALHAEALPEGIE